MSDVESKSNPQSNNILVRFTGSTKHVLKARKLSRNLTTKQWKDTVEKIFPKIKNKHWYGIYQQDWIEDSDDWSSAIFIYDKKNIKKHEFFMEITIFCDEQECLIPDWIPEATTTPKHKNKEKEKENKEKQEEKFQQPLFLSTTPIIRQSQSQPSQSQSSQSQSTVLSQPPLPPPPPPPHNLPPPPPPPPPPHHYPGVHPYYMHPRYSTSSGYPPPPPPEFFTSQTKHERRVKNLTRKGLPSYVVVPDSSLYRPHQHAGQSTPYERLAHKIVWTLQQQTHPIIAEELKKILPGRRRATEHDIDTVLQSYSKVGDTIKHYPFDGHKFPLNQGGDTRWSWSNTVVTDADPMSSAPGGPNEHVPDESDNPGTGHGVLPVVLLVPENSSHELK